MWHATDGCASGGVIRRFRGRSRPVAAALLLAVSLQACHGWVARTEPPREVLGTKEHSHVRVTTSDGVTREIIAAHVEGDSLKGYTDYTKPESARIAVSLGDIRSVETQSLHRVRTTLLVVGLGGVVLIGALAAALSSTDLGY